MASMSLPSGKVIVRRTTSPFTSLVTMSSRLMDPGELVLPGAQLRRCRRARRRGRGRSRDGAPGRGRGAGGRCRARRRPGLTISDCGGSCAERTGHRVSWNQNAPPASGERRAGRRRAAHAQEPPDGRAPVVEVLLEDHHRGHLVEQGAALPPGDAGLAQDLMGLHGGEPLVALHDRHRDVALQAVHECPHLLGLRAGRAVHVQREARRSTAAGSCCAHQRRDGLGVLPRTRRGSACRGPWPGSPSRRRAPRRSCAPPRRGPDNASTRRV